ncbi:hypothetical protein R1flu_014422 [Riccia fluitans]|uniref:Uncharacterized protein n=1 Tax=Riccia fluitans TaxID=41844 RepID=A0ABD1YGF8_9MARC
MKRVPCSGLAAFSAAAHGFKADRLTVVCLSKIAGGGFPGEPRRLCYLMCRCVYRVIGRMGVSLRAPTSVQIELFDQKGGEGYLREQYDGLATPLRPCAVWEVLTRIPAL